MTIYAILFGLIIVGLGAGWLVHAGKLGQANQSLNHALQVSQKENADLREKQATLVDDHANRVNDLNNTLEDLNDRTNNLHDKAEYLKDVVSNCDDATLVWPDH